MSASRFLFPDNNHRAPKVVESWPIKSVQNADINTSHFCCSIRYRHKLD
ncbi:hypothetical protein HCH_02134 [Hahella chejuensis KCTC 2396]|uniref:Uncharacterized protein n=1 Tax=Hahella chejuensis (strain KCTC 2396) TaxID=349521 RepID=Q2SK61_HAHCH|nr:hypothetical protein HCH_02134 [Hahella chejuensis KCTC 2396]